MEVRGRERIAFNFKDLLKSFVRSNGFNEDDLEKELNEILKQEDTDRISKLERITDPVKSTKTKKGGVRRKKGGLDVQTVGTKQRVASKSKEAKKAEGMERE